MLVWLILGGVLIFGCVSSKPILEVIQINRENARSKKQIAHLRMHNQQLLKTVALMHTPMGMEIQARKLGYMRKGELPLIVPK
jgi:cell division protein FtsB